MITSEILKKNLDFRPAVNASKVSVLEKSFFIEKWLLIIRMKKKSLDNVLNKV